MIYPSADKIDQEIDSKYALVVLAAKRARQIKEGARPLVPTDSANPLTVALEEIAGGKVKYEFNAESLAGQEALEDLRAVVGYRNIESEGSTAAAALDEPENLRAAKALLGADLGTVDLLGDEEADEESVAVDEEEEEDDPLATLDDEVEGTEA